MFNFASLLFLDDAVALESIKNEHLEAANNKDGTDLNAQTPQELTPVKRTPKKKVEKDYVYIGNEKEFKTILSGRSPVVDERRLKTKQKIKNDVQNRKELTKKMASDTYIKKNIYEDLESNSTDFNSNNVNANNELQKLQNALRISMSINNPCCSEDDFIEAEHSNDNHSTANTNTSNTACNNLFQPSRHNRFETGCDISVVDEFQGRRNHQIDTQCVPTVNETASEGTVAITNSNFMLPSSSQNQQQQTLDFERISVNETALEGVTAITNSNLVLPSGQKQEQQELNLKRTSRPESTHIANNVHSARRDASQRSTEQNTNNSTCLSGHVNQFCKYKSVIF